MTKPSGLIVLLHGYGSTPQRLLQLTTELRSSLPHLAVVAPEGPHRSAFDGHGVAAGAGRAWFPIAQMSPTALTRGVQGARCSMTEWIARELERHQLPASRLALVGFSQGGMLALDAGLHLPTPPAAILGFSSFLPGAEASKGLNGAPVTLVHGERDTIVPLFAAEGTATALRRAGVPVALHRLPGAGHWLTSDFLTIGADVLGKALSRGGRDASQVAS